MKTIDFVGAARTRGDGHAVFVFLATLQEGRDTHGKFNTRFVLAQHDTEDGEEPHLGIHVLETDDHFWFDPGKSLALIDLMLDRDEFVTAIDYDNLSWEAPFGEGRVIPVLGRTLGERFDWVERNELTPELRESLREMRGYLRSAGHEPADLDETDL